MQSSLVTTALMNRPRSALFYWENLLTAGGEASLDEGDCGYCLTPSRENAIAKDDSPAAVSCAEWSLIRLWQLRDWFFALVHYMAVEGCAATDSAALIKFKTPLGVELPSWVHNSQSARFQYPHNGDENFFDEGPSSDHFRMPLHPPCQVGAALYRGCANMYCPFQFCFSPDRIK